MKGHKHPCLTEGILYFPLNTKKYPGVFFNMSFCISFNSVPNPTTLATVRDTD